MNDEGNCPTMYVRAGLEQNGRSFEEVLSCVYDLLTTEKAWGHYEDYELDIEQFKYAIRILVESKVVRRGWVSLV